MDSSDDSFAWTSASSASDGEDTKMSKTSDAESEKKYKKKLHKKLFQDQKEAEVKQELLNGSIKHDIDSEDPTAYNSAGTNNRKRKRTSSQGSSAEYQYLKQKVKHEFSSKHQNSLYESDGNGDHNMELNASECTAQKKHKSKKSKRKTEYKLENQELAEISNESFKEYNKSEIEEMDVSRTDELVVESNDETLKVISKRKKGKKGKRKEDQDTLMTNGEDDYDKSLGSNYIDKEVPSHNNVENENVNTDYVDDNSHTKQQGQLQSRISDRIQFENDEEVNSHVDETHSTKLRKYLKLKKHLQTLHCKSSLEISQEEDIWLLQCPYEVDTLSLQGADLTLDSKCKVKIDSETFVGNIQDENMRIPILTCKRKKTVIKNVILNGIIHLHKRLPKPHYMLDNIIQNNQTDFIPLPETKSRHPLFGADYKKAMKIPSSIKCRLNKSYGDDDTDAVSSDSKKKKKRRACIPNEDLTHKCKEATESEGVEGDHKSRKRRKSMAQSAADDEEYIPKKKKCIKQELGSAEAWESERAIEENLFNL